MSNMEDIKNEAPGGVEISRAARREHAEPSCGEAPIPVWLIAICGVSLFFAGVYLGIFNGGFRGDVFNERDSSPALLFPQSATAATAAAAATETVESPVDLGKKFYSGNCVSCHQPTGKGVPGSFPPLAGSPFVQGGSKRLAMILLKGLQGPIKVNGATFNGAMPTWEKVLTDKKIAYILTYIRQEWGNNAGEITPEQIAAARKEFADHTTSWTEADLLAVPADEELPGGKAATPTPPPAAPEPKK